MKAVLLTPEFAATDGGLQRIVRLHLGALAEDPAITAITLIILADAPADLTDHPALAASRLHGKPIEVFAAAGSKAAFARAAWRAGSGASRIICAHVAQLPIAAVALRPGARLALVAHGIEVWEPLPHAQRLALARVHRVFCASRYTRQRLAANHDSLRSRLRIVPNAVAPALLNGLVSWVRPINEAPVILCVGRLSTALPHKGYDLLLRAFARMPRSSLNHRATLAPRLRYVGAGDAVPHLRALAADLQIADRVEFSGHLPDEDLRQAFTDCSCLALPSTGEGFGLVYLEALAAGRPCVGVEAGATPELVTPEVGMLAPPGDLDALATTLFECTSRFWSPVTLHERALNYNYARFAATLREAWQ